MASSNKDEVRLFLDNNSVDILLITETHFTEKSHFNIPQSKTDHSNHPNNRAHAGSAILIKNNISHYELPNFEKDFPMVQ